MRRSISWLALAFIIAIFAICLLWPILLVVRVGFFGVPVPGQPPQGFTLDYLNAIFLDADLRQGLLNSAGIAIGVTAVCMLIAIPLAIVSVRYDFAGKGLANALLLVP